MAKRKELDVAADMPRRKTKQADEGDSSNEVVKLCAYNQDMDMVNVDFEWFDPQEQDFEGVKMLLRQLLDSDAELFGLSQLADLILAQPLLGSTVKVGGNEEDPLAFLTVLNLKTHADKPAIEAMTKYLVEKSASSSPLAGLASLLSPSSNAEVGLILTERVMNLPAEIVPPMYRMLLEEIIWAVEDKEPYTFTHILVLSKTYTEVESKVDQEDNRPQKKKRKDKTDAIFYYHPEDEVLHQHAIGHCNFEYSKQSDEGASDSKRTFHDEGVKPQGHLILIEAEKFKSAVDAVSEYLNPQAL
ncbi:p21-C-terminal region-binding protein-domain-containing protein [Lineolata rhizophorae]|uniref:Protein BCP1 n=1 Tax=Lineolata rhizophorae TaxID=578093 RepID=A0A6A6P5L7_9PEZI|nr:p21-C-terminal region-binding protein-domain-containing protein [Lineolata rhizophorae]